MGRHHYVSQFHLRAFIDPISNETPGPWLWVGDRLLGTIARRSPKNVGWQRDLFAGPGGLADREASLEAHLSKEVEGPAASALRKWALLSPGNRGSIPPELFRYLTWAAARSLPMQRLYEEWINDMPVDPQFVEPAPPGYEKMRKGGGEHRMEHPELGVRDGVPSEQVNDLRKQGWRFRVGRTTFARSSTSRLGTSKSECFQDYGG
jgi:hypothetical protein